jgi:vitamin B12 transporter
MSGDGRQTVVLRGTARDALHPGLSFGFLDLSRGITTNAGLPSCNRTLLRPHNSVSIRYDDNSQFGDRTTWRVAPAWVIGDTKLKASAGTGFKSPALQQLYGTFGGNAALKPETSFGYDVGVEQSLLGGAVTGGVTWFQNNIKNLLVSGPATAFRLMDAGTKLALLRRPRHKASVNADWQASDDLSLDATLLYVGPQIDGNRDFSMPRLKMPDHVTLDLAASYRLTGKWRLFGRIENLTDTDYQSPDGFLRPRLGAYAGIKVKL